MTDTKEIITCPACEAEMTKIHIPETNFHIDVCERCGGMFFDNREYEKFVDTKQDVNELVENFKEKTFINVNSDKNRICPVCDIPMAKLGSKSNVQIDVCNICGGKFLDRGEIEAWEKKIAGHTDNEKLEKVLDIVEEYMPTNVSKSFGRKMSENFVRKFIV